MIDPFKPREDRDLFLSDLIPAANDIDENDHVNNVVYVRWMQDLGIAHWRARLPDDIRKDWVWVALRHEVDYRRPILPGQTAKAVTWVGDIDGPRLPRFVLIYGPDGQLAARGKTEWCLLKLPSRKPTRVSTELLAHFSR